MRVILIGFMGVGKTSVGKKLAKKLNFDFIDTDYEIEILANKTIPDIFVCQKDLQGIKQYSAEFEFIQK